jgi:hypothetical protein
MNLLNLESEKFKTVDVKGYQFKIRFMTPLDRVQIAQQRMLLQGGNPVEALSQYDFTFFENIGIVNICVETLPDNFKENESCIKWEDIELINGVAEEIKIHTEEIEQKLKKNKPLEGSAKK